jgi:cell division protein FtsW
MTAAPPTERPASARAPARRRPGVAPWANHPAWRALRRAVAFSVALLRGLSARPLASYYLLVSSAGLLLVIGLTMVFSATSVEAYVADGNAFTQIQKQALLAAVGLVAFWLCQRLPVRTYRALARPFLILAFAMVIALDVLALFASAGVLENPRLGPLRADELWLYLGPLQVQPSEFAKLALALWVADVLVRKGEQAGSWRELSRPLFPVVGLLLLLVGYNDLGTMLTLLVLFVGILWAAGVRLRVFLGMAVTALLGTLVLIYLPGNQYRSARIEGFLHPELSQLGDAYQVREGLFAIANGGWFGVGLGEGRLKWGWLPNGHNDFIFAVIAEELGVMGCLLVLTLFGVLAYTGLRIARRVSHPFRRLVAAGLTALVAGQATINIAGVVGLMPVTGLPLPLISDGGSALVVTLAMIGVLASFARAEPDAARTLHARPPGRLARLLWAPLPPMPVRVRPRRPDVTEERDE